MKGATGVWSSLPGPVPSIGRPAWIGMTAAAFARLPTAWPGELHDLQSLSYPRYRAYPLHPIATASILVMTPARPIR